MNWLNAKFHNVNEFNAAMLHGLVPCQLLVFGFVIPAQAGIQIAALDSRLRGNDEQPQFQALSRHW